MGPDVAETTPSGPALPPPLDLLRPRRTIQGWSAVLLPFDAEGAVDWAGFESLLARTVAAGLVPALNMDTGYANLLDEPTRTEVLDRTAASLGSSLWAAGAFVADTPGSAYDDQAYLTAVGDIAGRGGVPVIFQSFGLTEMAPEEIAGAYRRMGEHCEAFVAFELSTVFAPFGAIYDLDLYGALLDIDSCIGAKHSSLRRQLEWDRLRLRDRVRPEFCVFTGNDLAIDMVMYGSDYLLGLSAFAPDAFALRDRCWAAGSPAFFELNDVLAALGAFAFRQPVPAYKHDAAMFLALRGWLASDATHPAAPVRPDSDREYLRTLIDRLAELGVSDAY